ncbi:hypothetical protein [uncultured Fibrobacter sp.]|uniref:hypothetical protein n=1 Tax=uncultured Fibrobacter sp. TaxID=261512 RepID=UPI0025E76C63|nr:hypothetical protein [uncultured Fibrobacter sp.]
MKNSLILALFFLSFIACSEDSDESNMGYTYHYDTSISYDEKKILLDSISDCIIDSAAIESVYNSDTIFIEEKNGVEIVAFPSQVHSSIDNIKSIGTHLFGDTLKIELIEKEKTLEANLFCVVWVYGSVNEKISAKYIKTFTGVYPLGSK